LLNVIPGVVERGLFIGLAGIAMLAGPEGIRVIRRRWHRYFGRIGMKRLAKIMSAASLVLGLAFTGVPAGAQQPAGPPTPAAIAAAKELLAMKHASLTYSQVIPNIVQRTKDVLLANKLDYYRDLNEVAPIVAKNLAGRESEIGDAMAKIYATEFTEQELKDLVTFYKTPLGKKLLTSEPKAVQESMSYVNQWSQGFAEIVNAQFRAEMHKRGKEI
jgi:uncharacterized protein